MAVILKGFFDESGKEKEAPAFVLCGVVSRASRWRKFYPHWRRVLRTEGGRSIAHFKMNEAYRRKGQFAGWTDSEVQAKVSALLTVLKKHVEFHTVCVVWKDQYERLVRGTVPRRLDYEYLPAFWHTIRLVTNYMNTTRGHTKPVFIFDEQDECAVRARFLFDRLKREAASPESPSYQQAKWLGALEFADDKVDTPLQGADLVAWHYNRAIKDTVARRPERPIFSGIKGIPFRGATWTDKTLLRWQQGMIQMDRGEFST